MSGSDPVRSIRVGDLWDRCAALAALRRERMTVLVTRALENEERRLLGLAARHRYPASVFRKGQRP